MIGDSRFPPFFLPKQNGKANSCNHLNRSLETNKTSLALLHHITMSLSPSKTGSRPQVVCSNNVDGIEIELPTSRYVGFGPGDSTDCDADTNLDAPAIVNSTGYPIVVFLERGVLYNKQALLPGEAVTMSKGKTGSILPYRVHAVLGDESAIPTKTDSLKNLAKVSVVPAAFVAGCLVTAATAGTLVGPSMALAPLVTGMVVKGVVIDASAIAAGAFAADTAKKIAEVVIQNHKEKLMGVTGLLQPGQKYLSVTGGLFDGPVEIERIPKHVFDQLEIVTTKTLRKRRKPKHLKEERIKEDFGFKQRQSGIIE